MGARDNTLQPDAYQGANITLTNPGGIGTVASVPRLMPGQGTIVATGAIGYPPGLHGRRPGQARASSGVQKVMTMTSTYDHRVIQGAESGAFLRRIDQLLQGEDGFYDAVFGALGVDAPAEAPPVTAAEPVPAGSRTRGRAGRGRRRCSRRCRPPPRSSRRTACTATSPRGSTRSARSRWATRRSSRPRSGWTTS